MTLIVEADDLGTVSVSSPRLDRECHAAEVLVRGGQRADFWSGRASTG
ncbi:hypothetical protein ACGFZH_00580 [Streptomyces zaomyceticus]